MVDINVANFITIGLISIVAIAVVRFSLKAANVNFTI